MLNIVIFKESRTVHFSYIAFQGVEALQLNKTKRYKFTKENDR